MIYVKVETQRVYSHSENGMPKIEKIVQTFQDGMNFDKFLKYLPYQMYKSVKIHSVLEIDGQEKNEIDKDPWIAKLEAVLSKMNQPEESLQDKYEKEKLRNDELLARLERLEANLKVEQKPDELEKVDEKEIEEEPDVDEFEELKKQYFDKFGKNPHHLWKVETLKEKLNANNVR